MNRFRIGDRSVGEGQPALIIAELSANHRQNYDLAVQTVEAAKTCGADAVKLQTYTPDTLTLDSGAECFQIKNGGPWDGKTLYQLYQEACTPWEWQPKLKRVAEDLGMLCFSSPFDPTAVDFLEAMDVPAYKIASFEITDLPLIEYAAAKGKPMILSTGIASREDIEEAVAACKRKGNDRIALLKCTSAYPTPLDAVHLNTMADMRSRFRTVTGLSDHTLGISVPVAAVALGAKIIEKHLILDPALGGPDAGFSLGPDDFRAMTAAVREAEAALGEVRYALSECAVKNRQFARSLFAVAEIKKGERFTDANVRSLRPGQGLPPKYGPQIMGKKSRADIARGTPLRWDLIEEDAQ